MGSRHQSPPSHFPTEYNRQMLQLIRGTQKNTRDLEICHLVSPLAITDFYFYRTNPSSKNFLRPPPAIVKGFIQKHGENQESAPQLDTSGPFNVPSQLTLFKGFERLSASNSRPLVANRSGPSQNSILFDCNLIYEPMGGYWFLSFHPATLMSYFRTLEGLFELTQHP